MLVLEVTVNGKRTCVAGTEDLAVLTANVTACGRLGSKTVPQREDETVDIFYSVGGLTGRRKPENDVHVRWKSVEPLAVGDVVQIRVLDSQTADRAKSRKCANREKARKKP